MKFWALWELGVLASDTALKRRSRIPEYLEVFSGHDVAKYERLFGVRNCI
jgi:hypothetical protein